MKELKPCPCGQTPMEILTMDTGQGGKWANVYGSCCGEWCVEFRTGYHTPGSEEYLELAKSAWNEAPRG